MINWDALDTVDYLRSGALIVGFLALLVSDKRGSSVNIRGRRTNNWVNAEIVVFFVAGIVYYFFPENFLSYITNAKLNVYHELELQTLGVVLISFAVLTARIQKSLESDGHTHAFWLAARLLSSMQAVVTSVIAHQNNSDFTDQHMSFVVLFELLWFLGNLYQLKSVGNVGTGGLMSAGSASGVNRYLLIDFLFMVVTLIPTMAYPVYNYQLFAALNKPDPLNLLLTQKLASFVVINIVQSAGLVFSDNDGVKKQFFYARLVYLALALPLFLLYQWKGGLFTYNGTIIVLVCNVVLGFIYYKGYTYGDKIKTR